MVPQEGSTRREKPAIRFLLEGLLIVVSVVLGFAVAQYGESRANRELADRVLKGLRTEEEGNLSILACAAELTTGRCVQE